MSGRPKFIDTLEGVEFVASGPARETLQADALRARIANAKRRIEMWERKLREME